MNIGCDRCFYIAFNKGCFVIRSLLKNERMSVKTFWMLEPLKWNTGNTETSKEKINNCLYELQRKSPRNIGTAVLKKSGKFPGKNP